MSDPHPIEPRRILVTGGSRGIGFEIARDLVSAGHQVWLASASEAVLKAAGQLSPGVRASRLSVAEPHSVEHLFAEIHREFHGLDAVVHAAAELGESGHFWHLEPEKFLHTLRVNTVGAFLIARDFVRLWMAAFPAGHTPAHRGKIVLFAGGGAGYGYPHFLSYGTSKAADVRMCETMAMELDASELPIDINIIAPGANETSMLAAVRAAGGEVRTTVPFSKPIALCRWLLSPASDRINGRFIHVNDPYPTLTPGSIPADALKLRRIDL